MATLAERVAAVRLERGATPRPPPSRAGPSTERAEVLARWFGARLEAADDGAVLLVERRVPIDGRVAERLA
ncbi:MAG: hypothetical protein ACRDGJ_06295, partial [Candidatus Limnocylindria bacterium]